MKRLNLVLGGAALALAAVTATLAQDDDEKIGNAGDSMKAALQASGYQGKPGEITTAADAIKIAALQLEDEIDRADAAQIIGDLVQGGLGIGQTLPGATVELDGHEVPVDSEGRFIIGFDRDHRDSAQLFVRLPGGLERTKILPIAPRDFPTQRIDGLPDNQVSTFTEEEIAQIQASSAKKDAARAKPSSRTAFWANGFQWPVTGPISGVFGSQRILNGEPKRPHSGVDVAAPTGTDVRAPADGIVTLAETGMYFEGGLVFIDHGQGLESALMHLSRVDVQAGDEIKKGDIIGAVGATGRATGPHLHWSLKWQDRLVDAQLVVGEMPDS